MSFNQDFVDAAVAGRVSLGFFVSIDFPSGAWRAWLGRGSITHRGNTYTGRGEIISLSQVSELLDQRESRPTITLPADFAQSHIVDCRDGLADNSRAILDMAFLNPDTLAIYDHRPLLFGFVSMAEQVGETMEISLTDESAVVKRRTAHELTDGAQQALFPGDRGLEFATNPFDTKFGTGNTRRASSNGFYGGSFDSWGIQSVQN